MIRRAGVALAVLVSLSGSNVRAQVYTTPQPIPRTTNAPALHAQAIAREVHERFSIGLDAESRGDWPRAVAEFERIVSLQPPEPQGSTARYDLSIAYASVGRDRDAAIQLHAALALDPGFLAAMANLIAVDARSGSLQEARSVADRFVALAPDSARALYSRGIVALQTGDARTAQGDFSRLLVNNPSYAVAHYDLGVAEVRLGDDADAQREFETALTLAPSYARARLGLGTIFLKEGRRAEARLAFARAANDARSDPTLQNVASAMRDAIPAP